MSFVVQLRTRRVSLRRGLRRAMTLIELMVVVTIAVVVLAAAIPKLKPALEQGRVREASRQVNTYLKLAKSLSVQRGLPVGVAFQRVTDGSNASLDIYMVETPRPYSGDLVGATAVVKPEIVSTGVRYIIDFGTASGSLTSTNQWALVQPGETCYIRFNYQGSLYRVQRDSGGTYVLQIGNGQPPPGFWETGPDLQWGTPGDDDNNFIFNDLREAGWPGSDEAPPPPGIPLSIGQPFQVYLHPVPAAVKPLQLAGGASVDLKYSGYGINGQQFNATGIGDTQPTVIMFSPGGSVPTLYRGTPSSEITPLNSIYLLVGRFDQVEPPPDGSGTIPASTANQTNLADLHSIWVTVEPHSGTIGSAENVGGSSVSAAREIARTGQIMRGS